MALWSLWVGLSVLLRMRRRPDRAHRLVTGPTWPYVCIVLMYLLTWGGDPGNETQFVKKGDYLLGI